VAATATARARATRLAPRLVLRAGGSPDLNAASARACPAAVLVGIDAAPDTRMYAYTNFFGVLNASALAEASAALATTTAERCDGADGAVAAAALAAPPVILSYSHYPLGLISSSPKPGLWRGGGRELARILARHDVTAHVSGHLHDLAGSFMYRRHLAGADASSPGSSAVAEFEAGDWKAKRRWRLLAVDGPGVTVADFDFEGRRVRSLEPSATVSDPGSTPACDVLRRGGAKAAHRSLAWGRSWMLAAS
jgi:hypothetical protein